MVPERFFRAVVYPKAFLWLVVVVMICLARPFFMAFDTEMIV
jgi:lipopolysaccharide export LptBFGC system permease protein LptF